MGNDAEKREEIQKNIYETYNTCQHDCKTAEELIKKIDDGRTDKIKEYIEDKDFNEYYNKEKNKVVKDFKYNKHMELFYQFLNERNTPKVEYIYRSVESEESKRIRKEKEIEEQNRLAASEELPKFLDIVKKNFISKLDDKILKIKEKIEKELNNYSPSNLKIFFQKLAENENLEIKLIEYVKLESEKILLIFYKNSTHFNILLLGKTGIGKSTLINGIFNFKENEGAKTGEGKPITTEYDEYTSENRKGLRLIDSKGIEMGDYNINTVFNSAKHLIETKAREGDPDKLINCIWYCFKSSSLRFEPVEKEILSLLMNQYDDNKLPIIIVITQNFDDNDTEKMRDYIEKEFQYLNKEIIIMPVVAKKKIMNRKNNEFIIEKDGIEELIKISFEKSQKAVLPAVAKSIKEKIIQAFEESTENKKNKLKHNLKRNVQKILNGIKEDDKFEKSISKLSIIVKKTLNIFFGIGINNEEEDENVENENNQNQENVEQNEEEEKENLENGENIENKDNIENQDIQEDEEVKEDEEKIDNEENVENNINKVEEINNNEQQNENQEINPEKENQEKEENNNEKIEDEYNIEMEGISEKSKKEINLFLDDLCKWSIGRLNDIISDLIKENSEELTILLFNEQEKVKKDKNVERKLSNEKSINDYQNESEHDLKPLIMKKVYFLAIKNIFNIISQNSVKVSEDIMKEQFNKIVPELRNYISDDKLKKISEEILEEIIKNNYN